MADKTTLEAYQETAEAWVELRQALIEAFQLERIVDWLARLLSKMIAWKAGIRATRKEC